MLKKFLMALIFLSLILIICAGAGAADFNINLNKMRNDNPDFTTFPNYDGIIWLKQSEFTKNKQNNFERTHLYVILGRKGLNNKWLDWNIVNDLNNKSEVLRAEIYDYRTGRLIKAVEPELKAGQNIINVNYLKDLENLNNDNFIIVISWREVRETSGGESLDLNLFEDVFYFQEELPVWEAIADVKFSFAPKPEFKTFPKNIQPERDKDVYRWRQVNLNVYNKNNMIVGERSGLIFGMRSGEAGLAAVMREYVNNLKTPEPEAKLNLNKVNDVLKWLYAQPEINLAGTSQRVIPAQAPWTKNEKVLIAYNWLKNAKGVKSKSLSWLLPLEVQDNMPMCHEILSDAVLELAGKNKQSPNALGYFHDFTSEPLDNTTPQLLRGRRIISAAGLNENLPSGNGTLLKRKIPEGKGAANNLSANLNLNLDAQGVLSGKINVEIKGAWRDYLMAEDIKPESLVMKLFPALSLNNFSKAELKHNDKTKSLELNFNLDRKPGIAGTTGERLLAIPPSFAPSFLDEIRGGVLPFDILFPFVMQQKININPPKGTERILTASEIKKYPEKINYGEASSGRHNKFAANSRLEVNAYKINEDNAGSLRRSVEMWKNFSSRQIPVQVKIKAAKAKK